MSTMRSDWHRHRSEPKRVEIEALDRFDLIAEEIDADGQADLLAGLFKIARQIDIDDSAAHGEIAGDFDLIQPVVAMLGEPDDQLLRLELLARLQSVSMSCVELLARGDRLHQRLDRRDEHARSFATLAA